MIAANVSEQSYLMLISSLPFEKNKIKTGITEMFEKSIGHYKTSRCILGLKFIHWLCYILMADAIS